MCSRLGVTASESNHLILQPQTHWPVACNACARGLAHCIQAANSTNPRISSRFAATNAYNPGFAVDTGGIAQARSGSGSDGAVLFRVFLQSDSHAHHVASIIARTPAFRSEYGDQSLMFQHPVRFDRHNDACVFTRTWRPHWDRECHELATTWEASPDTITWLLLHSSLHPSASGAFLLH